jgi:excinuclease ABC subunit C
MRLEKSDIRLRNLPSSPGVYLFKNAEGKIIYIGKARNLRKRVRAYFRGSHRLDAKTARLAEQIADFDLIVTDNEIEALILEANLVKEHRPRYNINLKDDKHYPYIRVTVNEPFPRLLVARRLERDGARYFGPYASSASMRRTIKFLSDLFRIRRCNLTIPHPTGKKQKVCLDYHIGHCGGPCEGLQTEKDYREAIDGALMFLSGRNETLIESLQKKMESLSKRMRFEEAGRLRDQINALRNVRERQKVDAGKLVNRDIIAYAREGRETVVVALQIREGVLIGRQDFQLSSDIEENDGEVISGFVRQYYNAQPNLPDEIYLPLKLPDEALICRWLSSVSGRKVEIWVPQKGEKVKLVDMAAANARLLLDELLIQRRVYRERTARSVQILKQELHLSKSPYSMACVDISNLGSDDAVGSLVYFENGKPKKSKYRRFRIKYVVGQDDFSMIREVIGRYFFRIKDENLAPPDLLIVDGGKGQLSSALMELRALGYEDQNIIGLAKRLEEIYLPNHSDPISLLKTSPGLRLLKQIRDEAHRFAIEYGRKVRAKRTIESELSGLKGVGARRREILLRHFGSAARVRSASLEEIKSVKGIPKDIAEKIYNAYR